jgi:hypothetical protein
LRRFQVFLTGVSDTGKTEGNLSRLRGQAFPRATTNNWRYTMSTIMSFRALVTSLVAAGAVVLTGNIAIAQVIQQNGDTSAAVAAASSTKQARADLAARLALTKAFLNKSVTQQKMTLAEQGGDPAAQLIEGLSEEQVTRALAATTPAELEAVLFGSQAARDLLSTLLDKHTSVAGIQKALGDYSADLVFTPLQPCRIMDTRGTGWSAAAPLAANVARSFDILAAAITAQGGVQTGGCGIPANAQAMSVNITVVSPAAGWLYFWPDGYPQPNASILNWNGASTGYIANAAVVAINPTAPAGWILSSVGGTHVIMDALGYFAAPFATALQCVTTAEATISVAAATVFTLNAPACAAGYTKVSAGCRSGSYNTTVRATVNEGSDCQGYNFSGAAESQYATARCCRVPGR